MFSLDINCSVSDASFMEKSWVANWQFSCFLAGGRNTTTLPDIGWDGILVSELSRCLNSVSISMSELSRCLNSVSILMSELSRCLNYPGGLNIHFLSGVMGWRFCCGTCLSLPSLMVSYCLSSLVVCRALAVFVRFRSVAACRWLPSLFF